MSSSPPFTAPDAAIQGNANSMSSSCSTAENTTKHVCFGTLTIYEFPNLLGDNPGVKDGAPLTIDWKHTTFEKFSIDYYEYLRKNKPRRSRRQLVVDAGTRGSFLLGQGYSLNEVLKAAAEVDMIQDSRRANMKGKFEAFKDVFLRKTSDGKGIRLSSNPFTKVAKSA